MYVKQVELTRFKSFGSTTAIPFLPGFTVVSGPNGSGKSNILDALLFALGLASTRGMRAERLPDLVHTAKLENGNGAKRRKETSVSVTFAIPHPEQGEVDWQVTRRLRVAAGAESYSSTYYINNVPCTLSELHTQLAEMRIYPDGYNVVLQGDVTSIITMNSRERRQIIDELAGVANFDRKIGQARDKLEAVHEQEERSQLVMQELDEQSERLRRASQKAQRYQQLRAELNELERWQVVLTQRHLQIQIAETEAEIEQACAQERQAIAKLEEVEAAIGREETRFTEINQHVRQLGEENYLNLQSELAAAQAQIQQYERQAEQRESERVAAVERQRASAVALEQLERDRQALEGEARQLTEQVPQLEADKAQCESALQHSRDRLQEIARSSDAWNEQHNLLTQHLQAAQQQFGPLDAERIRLTESKHLLERQLQANRAEWQELDTWLRDRAEQTADLTQTAAEADAAVRQLAEELANVQTALDTDRTTARRLRSEWQEQQRKLDRLETRQQTIQESLGTKATQVILQADLSGVCGLVAQLGQVDPRYQLAMEIAAGNRLNHLVVETDDVAAQAIALLKRKQAGRATLLPLNKLREARPLSPLRAVGAVDYALNLVEFEPRFRDVFAFVFGQTIIFETLERARPHIGRYRIVTVDGELLELSGAMTGGSSRQRSRLHFSAAESDEMTAVQSRYRELSDVLAALDPRIEIGQARVKELAAALNQAQSSARTRVTAFQGHQAELRSRQERHDLLQASIAQQQAELAQTRDRLAQVTAELEPWSERVRNLAEKLTQLEQSTANHRWQETQAAVRACEANVERATLALQRHERQQQSIASQQQLAAEKITQQQLGQQEWHDRIEQLQAQTVELEGQQQTTQERVDEIQTRLTALSTRIDSARAERDRQELAVKSLQQQAQRLEWESHTAAAQQREKSDLLPNLRQQLEALADDHREWLNQPPEVPEELTLEDAQQQTRKLETKLRSLEPVNMLALEEYEATQARQQDLAAKLETLQRERTELLLRIENFTTLRTQAFMEAFQEVDRHFRTIFAQLSDGDGHLQLDDTEDPLRGGLTLVAHPKGKPVRRLASMSGGEKSLTALSFIFALQRFRPSTFYAFDEVDMFLDGANVEKLAAMVSQQSQQAQFIVVSLRRPMIERAQRTIGVTQARGAVTQVIGLQNRA
ncbi:MAG: chromosome segregation protein SMC [Cyanobacteria bacterium P01_F01_bin.33]